LIANSYKHNHHNRYCFLSFYIVDIIIGLLAFKTARYLQMRWNLAYVISSVIMLVESLFTCTNYTRPLLSVILICRVSSLRNTTASIFRSIPQASEVFLLFFTLLTFYSTLGVVFWRDCYQNLDTEFTGSFDNFGRAAIAMFVLSTTENYPFVMYPAMDRYPYSAVVFFVSYLMIVFYLVLALFQAALYSEWKQDLNRQLLKNRVETYNALLVAFHVLVDDGSSFMPEKMWCDLVKRLKPKATHDEAVFMFAIMDTNNDKRISLREFLANATDAIKLDFSQLKRDLRQSNERVKRHRNRIVKFGEKSRPVIKRMMRKSWFEPLCIFNVVCHTFVLCCIEFPMRQVEVTFENVFLFFSVVEMALKFTAYPNLYLWKVAAKIDFVVIIASVITEWVLRSFFHFNGVNHIASVTQCLRVFRLISLSKRMRQVSMSGER